MRRMTAVPAVALAFWACGCASTPAATATGSAAAPCPSVARGTAPSGAHLATVLHTLPTPPGSVRVPAPAGFHPTR